MFSQVGGDSPGQQPRGFSDQIQQARKIQQNFDQDYEEYQNDLEEEILEDIDAEHFDPQDFRSENRGQNRGAPREGRNQGPQTQGRYAGSTNRGDGYGSGGGQSRELQRPSAPEYSNNMKLSQEEYLQRRG